MGVSRAKRQPKFGDGGGWYCDSSRWNWRGPIGHKFQSTTTTTTLEGRRKVETQSALKASLAYFAPWIFIATWSKGTLIGSRPSLVCARHVTQRGQRKRKFHECARSLIGSWNLHWTKRRSFVVRSYRSVPVRMDNFWVDRVASSYRLIVQAIFQNCVYELWKLIFFSQTLKCM